MPARRGAGSPRSRAGTNDGGQRRNPGARGLRRRDAAAQTTNQRQSRRELNEPVEGGHALARVDAATTRRLSYESDAGATIEQLPALADRIRLVHRSVPPPLPAPPPPPPPSADDAAAALVQAPLPRGDPSGRRRPLHLPREARVEDINRLDSPSDSTFPSTAVSGGLPLHPHPQNLSCLPKLGFRFTAFEMQNQRDQAADMLNSPEKLWEWANRNSYDYQSAKVYWERTLHGSSNAADVGRTNYIDEVGVPWSERGWQSGGGSSKTSKGESSGDANKKDTATKSSSSRGSAQKDTSSKDTSSKSTSTS